MLENFDRFAVFVFRSSEAGKQSLGPAEFSQLASPFVNRFRGKPPRVPRGPGLPPSLPLPGLLAY